MDDSTPDKLAAEVFATRLIETARVVQRRTSYPVHDALMVIAGIGGDGKTKALVINSITGPLAKAILSGDYEDKLSLATYRGFEIDLTTRVGTTPYEDHKAFLATPIESRLLYLLLNNGGRGVSYSRLLDFAWGVEESDHTLLKTHFSHIRDLIGDRREEIEGTLQHRHIRVILGYGYRFYADPINDSPNGILL